MFSESADLYDAIYSFKNYAAEAAQIAALLRATNPVTRTVLDVACGTGEHARLLALAHGFEVDGIDLDPGLIRVARSKHPSGRFVEADMSAFALGRRYDAVLCLFSSIGYALTQARVRSALRCFKDHLADGGVVLVEPWFPPGVLEAGRVTRQTGEANGVSVERVSRTDIAGRVSRLHFDYRIEDHTGVRRAREVHELGLFTLEEMAACFTDAGLTTTFSPEGLGTGRGLWRASVAGSYETHTVSS